jgi:hypothetical protein
MPQTGQVGRSFFRLPVTIVRKALVGSLVFGVTYVSFAHLRPILLSHRPLPGQGGASGRCAIWFVGSSTVARWTTMAQDMRPWRTNNRGVADALADEIVSRFAAEGRTQAPDIIVLYVGDNDLARGVTARAITGKVAQFLQDVHGRMPRTRVVVLGVKPSPARWSLRDQQVELDRMIRRVTQARAGVSFADVAPVLIVDGRPGPYYLDDGIHLDPDGYRVWSQRVRRAVDASAAAGGMAPCIVQPDTAA